MAVFLVGVEAASVAHDSTHANKSAGQLAHSASSLTRKYALMREAFGSKNTPAVQDLRTSRIKTTQAKILQNRQLISQNFRAGYKQHNAIISHGTASAPVASATTSLSASVVRPSPRVPTLLPVIDQADITDQHKRIADEVLRLFPATCQIALKNFYVRYDNPEHRGLGGKNTIILTGNVPDDEFRALFIHELGHVFDLNQNTGCLGGNPSSGESEFRDGNDQVYNDDPSLQFYRISWTDSKVQRKDAKPEDFASGYASWDAFEDFAEAFAMFILQNDAFRERARTNAAMAAKYAWFETYMFRQNPRFASGNFAWQGSVPWDITKLPYVWNGGQERPTNG